MATRGKRYKGQVSGFANGRPVYSMSSQGNLAGYRNGDTMPGVLVGYDRGRPLYGISTGCIGTGSRHLGELIGYRNARPVYAVSDNCEYGPYGSGSIGSGGGSGGGSLGYGSGICVDGEESGFFRDVSSIATTGVTWHVGGSGVSAKAIWCLLYPSSVSDELVLSNNPAYPPFNVTQVEIHFAWAFLDHSFSSPIEDALESITFQWYSKASGTDQPIGDPKTYTPDPGSSQGSIYFGSDAWNHTWSGDDFTSSHLSLHATVRSKNYVLPSGAEPYFIFQSIIEPGSDPDSNYPGVIFRHCKTPLMSFIPTFGPCNFNDLLRPDPQYPPFLPGSLWLGITKVESSVGSVLYESGGYCGVNQIHMHWVPFPDSHYTTTGFGPIINYNWIGKAKRGLLPGESSSYPNNGYDDYPYVVAMANCTEFAIWNQIGGLVCPGLGPIGNALESGTGGTIGEYSDLMYYGLYNAYQDYLSGDPTCWIIRESDNAAFVVGLYLPFNASHYDCNLFSVNRYAVVYFTLSYFAPNPP